MSRFLLAQLYLDLLQDKTSAREMKTALEELHRQSQGQLTEDKKLDALTEAYKHAMERINGQKTGFQRLAKEVLAWITCAKRPLTPLELQHALAVNIGHSELDRENLREIEDIVSVCAGLVTVDNESGIILLVHYTTQEYFERTQSQWFPNAETNITTICVTYLSFNSFKRGFCQTDDEFKERLQLNQFFEYAARNWGHHARKISTLSQALSQLLIDFLESEAKVNASSQGLLAIKDYLSHLTYSQHIPRRMTGLQLAAYFGVEIIVKLLLEKGAEVEAKNSWAQTPLLYAAQKGHEAVVRLLVEKGAELESIDSEYNRTPLWYAAQSGNEAIVNLLLEKGAELESKDSHYNWTPLLWQEIITMKIQ